MPQLSVIVPVYNEAKTIRQILEKINSVNIDKEIIVVDDGSSDGTDKILREIKYDNLKVIHHTSNRGKGSAILTGLLHGAGELVVIQDADLEYDPNDYLKLIKPIKQGVADLVLGVRFTKGYSGLLIHRWGNIFLTGLLNLLFNTRLNDCFTCYKMLRRDTVNMLNLRARSFDIEVEIVTKAIRNKLRIVEIPISYHPRSYSEGKKIRLRDGIWAALNILKTRFRQ
jgi:glycosyltransferase involved in cell wall biosynthesis